ncbi:restriction endonuclease subunit S [Rheinheimera muenzenbergensis]|uniref:Restriction endonuclease subunit S n=1 Tax=Rheinheimera muenzenbergensis TaxID=1193628 RepID=A0ABU8C3N5_9GAMM
MSEFVTYPSNWIITSIGAVCDFHSGAGFPVDMQGLSDQDLPFYKVKDVSIAWLANSTQLLSTEHSLSYADANYIKAKPVPEGAVIFAKIGEALRLNRRALAPKTCLIDNNLMGISAPQARLASRYLYWFSVATKFDVDARASVVPSIRKSDIENVPFPLPPINEQVRIVTKLEELLTDLDAGVSELKTAQKKLVQYRQSLLKAAVEGVLTAEWRQNNKATETGAQLLERILIERRARWEAKQLAKFKEQGKAPSKDWQKKYPEPVQPETTDLPELPDSWVWASVEQLGNVQLGRQRSPNKVGKANPTLYIRAANITEAGVDLNDVLEMEFSETEKETFALKFGDVLLTEASGSPQHVGRPAIWKHTEGLYCFQNTVLRFSPQGISSEYAFYSFLAMQKLGVFSKLSGGVGINHLSAGKFSRLPVPLPPAAEQIALNDCIEECFAKCDELKIHIVHSLKQSAAQRQNILRAAFAGQLVPQDQNDEPASVLLERIRAERAELTKQPKVRKTKPNKEITIVASKLMDVLKDAGDWLPAQEAFRRCGVADGAETNRIEELYAELRELDKAKRLEVEPVKDKQGRKLYDKLKLRAD